MKDNWIKAQIEMPDGRRCSIKIRAKHYARLSVFGDTHAMGLWERIRFVLGMITPRAVNPYTPIKEEEE